MSDITEKTIIDSLEEHGNEQGLVGLSKSINNFDLEEDTKGKFLTFFTDKQLFGVPIADVIQIVGMQEIVEVPGYPSFAKGIINLRGAIIPVIDMRLRLKREEIPYNERTCTIVTNINEVGFGFIVDGVDEVIDIEDSKISFPPKVSNDVANDYVTGIGNVNNKVILLLDTSKILKNDEIDVLTDLPE